MVESSEFRQRLIDRALSSASSTTAGASNSTRGSLRDYYKQKKVVNKLSTKLQETNNLKNIGGATKHSRSPSSVTTATETDESYTSSGKLASPSNQSAFTPITTRDTLSPLTPVSAIRSINLAGSYEHTTSPAITDASGSALQGLDFAYLAPQAPDLSNKETRESIQDVPKVNYFQPIEGATGKEMELPPPPPPTVQQSYRKPLKKAEEDSTNEMTETKKVKRRTKKPSTRGRSRTRRSLDSEDQSIDESFHTIEDSEFGSYEQDYEHEYYDDGYDEMSQGTFLGALLCGSLCGATETTSQRSKSKSRSRPSKSRKSRDRSRSLSSKKLTDAYLDMVERTLQLQESRTRSEGLEENYDSNYAKYALNDSAETAVTNNTSNVENSFDAPKADLVAVFQGKVRRKVMDQSTPSSKADIKQLV